MIGVRLGWAEHIQDANAILSLVLDDEDVNSIQEATKKGKNLLQVIGDCGDEYWRVEYRLHAFKTQDLCWDSYIWVQYLTKFEMV